MRKEISLVIVFLLCSLYSWAQPGGGGDPGGNVPITGIEILLGLGGALGVKRLMGVKEKSKNP